MNRIQIDMNPRYAGIVRVWREDHCLKLSTIRVYLHWVRLFEIYCRTKELDGNAELTLSGVAAFVRWYVRRHRIHKREAFAKARSGLRALTHVGRAMHVALPEWTAIPSPRPMAPLLTEFAAFLREHRGSPEQTIRKKLEHAERFLTFLRSRHGGSVHVSLIDIDAFLIRCGQRYARTTTADFGSSIRGFLRFLLATGRIGSDLASSVISPVIRKAERPLRALQWADVRRILAAVDRTGTHGRRDYAMLLMMATYGLGAGEIIRITLDDIDWRAATLRITRPKTGVSFLLPLLSAVARALVDYLRHGRPVHAQLRNLFFRFQTPYLPFSCSSAIRHIIIKHARLAGVSAPYLGAHVLRHTHACRQMEQGTRPKIIGDILGHRDPSSISAYVRVSPGRLRPVSLPVPS